MVQQRPGRGQELREEQRSRKYSKIRKLEHKYKLRKAQESNLFRVHYPGYGLASRPLTIRAAFLDGNRRHCPSHALRHARPFEERCSYYLHDFQNDSVGSGVEPEGRFRDAVFKTVKLTNAQAYQKEPPTMRDSNSRPGLLLVPLP